MDFEKFYTPAPKQFESYLNKKITLKNVGVLKQYPYGSHYNVNFCDDDTHLAVIEDIISYKNFGGGSIVENTTYGLKRNLKLLYEISSKSGVHVIAGTGHYVSGNQEADVLNMKTEEMVDLYTKEITTGVDIGMGINVKCGIIGEVGSVWPIHDFEKRSIQATAEVQSFLKCGVSFHPGRDTKAPFEIIRIYLEAGGRADKCVMSHLDRTILDNETLLEFASLGVYCQFDLFGTECSFYQLSPIVDMPSDAQRLNQIMALFNDGKDKVMMSHDIHTKHRLSSFGGHGFAHIINNVLPKLKLKGLTDEQIDKITIKNPAEWLQFNF